MAINILANRDPFSIQKYNDFLHQEFLHHCFVWCCFLALGTMPSSLVFLADSFQSSMPTLLRLWWNHQFTLPLVHCSSPLPLHALISHLTQLRLYDSSLYFSLPYKFNSLHFTSRAKSLPWLNPTLLMFYPCLSADDSGCRKALLYAELLHLKSFLRMNC